MTKAIQNIIRDASKLLLGRGWGGLILLLFSCVNDIPYDAEIGAPKLVLNAMLTPNGQQMTATVSRTVHFLDTEEPQRLDDATVIATINGEEYALTYDATTGQYLSYYGLNAGDEVTLTATHTLGTATATQCVVYPTPIAVAGTTMQPFTPPADPLSGMLLSDVDSALLVSLHVNDPADEANYYRLTINYEGSYDVTFRDDIYAEQSSQTPPKSSPRGGLASIADSTLSPWGNKSEVSGSSTYQETFYPHYLLTESSSQLFTSSESAGQLLSGLMYMSSYNSFLFTDEQLRNREGEPVIDFLMLLETPATRYDDMFDPEHGWEEGTTDGYIAPADTVSRANYHYSFMLETLSEDYYRYLTTVASYSIMGGTFVGEPTHIHSNIRGGLGIVGSYSTAECNGTRTYKVR